MIIEPTSFQSRSDRYAFVARVYREILRGRVLDVGCDQGQLKGMLDADVEYVGTDLGGKADYQIDLEKVDRLPFGTASFDCVVCNDVLEHLDPLHHVFEELLRVSSRYLIIALPNCWRTVRSRLPRGHGTPQHYGLPLTPPADRHKWFFNVEDIVNFMKGNERRLLYTVKEFRCSEKPHTGARKLLRLARRLRHPDQMRYLNRYGHRVWSVLEKTRSG